MTIPHHRPCPGRRDRPARPGCRRPPASSGDAAGADPQRVDVVAAFYPLQFLAERIGGDAVR